ncbi:hypothetical protein [Amycolatopsis rifamycinica]|uniref:hypothetical protein n=1 Tax=Amycolatopsis rifamycinica TaxID=287986 RepID=UPI0013623128|nr:hypothetical protein [Amycolatopsis rifamycinica]
MTERPDNGEIFTRDDDPGHRPPSARAVAARRWSPAPPWDSDEFDAFDVFEAGEAA